MKSLLSVFSVVLLMAGAAMAQSYRATNSIYRGSNSVARPNPVVAQTNVGQALPPENSPAIPELPAPPAAPAEAQTAQTTTSEKPAVVITAQGTVLNEDQKRQISQRLQEIPGVVVITNRIHVVGDVNEAAGALRTNRNATPRHRRQF